MNFRSVAQLNRDLTNWLPKLPPDIEVIAGIPRSGLLVANLLSLHLGLPLTDIDGLLAGRVLTAGVRYPEFDPVEFLLTRRKVLVVDDSLSSGGSLHRVHKEIKAARLPHKFEYAVVYVVPGRERKVDHFCEALSQPRLFEWNWRNSFHLQHACVDIDGVLCRDPSPKENDDGRRYKKFIDTVAPDFVPRMSIGWLVSCRLEKYRDATENWLRHHGFEYGELILMDYPDMAARKAAGNYAEFKAEAYRRTDATVFIESSHRQATEIAALTHRPVLCTETMELVSEKEAVREFA